MVLYNIKKEEAKKAIMEAKLKVFDNICDVWGRYYSVVFRFRYVSGTGNIQKRLEIPVKVRNVRVNMGTGRVQWRYILVRVFQRIFFFFAERKNSFFF